MRQNDQYKVTAYVTHPTLMHLHTTTHPSFAWVYFPPIIHMPQPHLTQPHMHIDLKSITLSNTKVLAVNKIYGLCTISGKSSALVF